VFYIGWNKEVAVGNQTSWRCYSICAEKMDEVVVYALGMKREKGLWAMGCSV